MLQTRPDDRFAIIPHRTRFYSKNESGAVVNAEFLDASYKVPRRLVGTDLQRQVATHARIAEVFRSECLERLFHDFQQLW